MTILEKIIDEHPDVDFLKVDGFDLAVVGYEILSNRLVYDYNKMAEILMEEGMTDEEAVEYLDYNVLMGYVGEQTPIYIQAEYFR
jgi:hypothetical protein